MLTAKYLEESLDNKADEYYDEDTKVGLVKACGCWFLNGVLDALFIGGAVVVLVTWIQAIIEVFKKD